MKVKLVVSLPSQANVEDFLTFCKHAFLGRYENDRNIKEYWLPTLMPCGYRGYIKGDEKHTCTLYECDAAELEPAVISVIDELAHFGFLSYDFRIGGKSIGVDWWKPSDDELLDEGCTCGFEDTDNYGKVIYDATAARYAADIFRNKLNYLVAEFDDSAKKIA